MIDPSFRATEWLKTHLKESRLEVINQQVQYLFLVLQFCSAWACSIPDFAEQFLKGCDSSQQKWDYVSWSIYFLRVLGYNDSYMILKMCLLKEEIRVFKIGWSASGITSTSLPLRAALSKNIRFSCWEGDSKRFVNREVFCILGWSSLDFKSLYTLLP